MHESPVTDQMKAYLLGPFPLVQKAGCVVVTTERIYFQPFYGLGVGVSSAGTLAGDGVGDGSGDANGIRHGHGTGTGAYSKALSWSLRDIVATARRYHGLKDEAVELFLDEESRNRTRTGSSVLIAFDGYRNRENIFRLFPTSRTVKVAGRVGGGGGEAEVPVLCHTDRSFLSMVVNAWKNGEIDNFEYLLALNSAAGRSMLDLSRYPIFPWVLADYQSDTLDLSGDTFRDLSKPIGALNPERLESFKARWKNMQDMGGAFLYGTHYSAPGYCLYYLVREVPEQMLCLQNGEY